MSEHSRALHSTPASALLHKRMTRCLMATRRRHVIAACALLLGSSLWLGPTWLSAQNRFEALKQDTIPEVPGLRIITVRDTLLDTCYTLFMSEPFGVADVGAQAPPIDDARQQ